MSRKTDKTVQSLFCIFAMLSCLLFFACSSHSEGSAFLTNLNAIDAYIKQAQTHDALSLLKKAEKQAYSAYARIGVYRRYMTLGEVAKAEKVLQRGLKSLRENTELSAVYAHFLLRQERVDDAIRVARCLEGSSYGSIYSEAVLKKRFATVRNDTTIITLTPFLTDELAPIYYDAYTGTKDERWLRDSALVSLASGDYAGAAAMQQPSADAQDALFWALVQYDAGNYDLCLATLAIPGGDYLVPMTELASDAYMALGDADSAEQLRAKLIDAWQAGEQDVLPCSLYLNSALWSWAHEDYKRTYDLLLTAITTYPDDVPTLVSYGNIAYEQTKVPELTDLEQTLRRTALRTQRMEMYDERPKILLSDALYRIDTAIAKQKTTDLPPDDRLLAARAQLELQSHPDMVVTAKLAYIWQMLEENELRRNMYPPLLVQLAVHELLKQGEVSDARHLFENYIDARYNLSASATEKKTTAMVQQDIFGGERRIPAAVIPVEVLRSAFGDRAALNAASMEVWEGETAAYFALLDKNITAARRLYEYVLYESRAAHASVGAYAAVSSTANLAVIYSSTRSYEKALELYGQAAGRSEDSLIKSTILYRSALLQVKLQDIRGALLSLEYSLGLNPANADAKLLKRQLGQ